MLLNVFLLAVVSDVTGYEALWWYDISVLLDTVILIQPTICIYFLIDFYLCMESLLYTVLYFELDTIIRY